MNDKESKRNYLKTVGVLGAGLAIGAGAGWVLKPSDGAGGPVTTGGGALRVAQFAEPITINPNITMAGDVWGAQVEHMIFDRLVDVLYDRTGKSIVHVPMIATGWVTEDEGKTYIFDIRQGVQWHKDYGELTAEDVAWNVNDTVQQQRARVSVYYFVQRAEVLSDYQVAIYLEEPFAPFLSTIAYQGLSVIPKAAYESIGHENFGRNPVGSGPFIFDQWLEGDFIKLVKNPNYWKKGLPLVDEITYKPIPDAFTKTQALINDELDIIDGVDYKDVESLEANPDITVNRVDGWNFDFLSFRIDKLLKAGEETPFSDVRVRQAINYAVDRQEIVDSVYFGYARPTTIPLMPHDLGYTTKKYFPDTADIPKAQQLLDDAGYGDGFTVTVITGNKSNLLREIQIIQAQLAKVNINLEIESMELGAWVNQYWIPFDEKEFIMSHGDVDRVTDDSDSGLWWFYYPETIGWTGLDTVQSGVSKLLEEARTNTDPAIRHQKYQQVLDLAIPESQYVYLVTRQMIQPTRKRVQNYYPKPKENFYQFDEVYLRS
jgi:peptide/nickel transport system substrate-binding protein